VKRAHVGVLRAGPVSPGKFLVLIDGGVEEVDEAMEAGLAAAAGTLVDRVFLAQPHPQLVDALAGFGFGDGDVDAFAVVETWTVGAAIRAVDMALKTADVRLTELRLAEHIGGKAFFAFTGDQHMVEAGLAAAEAHAGPGTIAHVTLIARPHADFVAALVAPR
jgi:microcompartment protein CcmL/EutN